MESIKKLIRTGALGPVILGAPTLNLLDELGEPDSLSEKTNPLLANYGCLSLIFLKSKGERQQTLREFKIDLTFANALLPSSLSISDWPVQPATQNWLHNIAGIRPTEIGRGYNEEKIMFASGVIATVEKDRVTSLSMAEREIKSQPIFKLQRASEPDAKQINSIIREAKTAARASAYNAAILLGWGALEALLRRLAFQSNVEESGPTPSNLLVQKLRALNLIPDEVFSNIESIRQIRSAVAHGINTHSGGRIEYYILMTTIRQLMVLLRQNSDRKTTTQ